MLGAILCCVIVAVWSPVSQGVKLIDVKVPRYRPVGSKANLMCNFDLEHDSLYAVKWYRDGFEFFRYMPGEETSSRIFPMPGIKLDLSQTKEGQVVLEDLTLNSSGTYRCEVSAEAPSFQTVGANRDMLVIVPPDDVPEITGLVQSYNIYDRVVGHCVSRRTSPPTTLMWYINEEKAPRDTLVEVPTITDDDGMATSALDIHFTAQNHHFPDGTLHLRCRAMIGNFQWEREKEAYLADFLQQQTLAEHKQLASGVPDGRLLCHFVIALQVITLIFML